MATAPGVLLDELPVRERCLRVVVSPVQQGMGGQRVEVPPVLLDVLAVVALAVGEAEETLLENWVRTIVQGQREAQAVLVVGDPGEPVLAPAIGPTAGVVVRQVVPGVSASAVVLANRPPLALG